MIALTLATWGCAVLLVLFYMDDAYDWWQVHLETEARQERDRSSGTDPHERMPMNTATEDAKNSQPEVPHGKR